MPKFKDSQGREWTVEIDVATMKRTKTAIGYDIASWRDFNVAASLANEDPVTFVDVLFCLIKPQADKLGVTDEEFGRSMAGDAYSAACDAVWDAWVLFCPSPGRRKALGLLAEKGRAYSRKLEETQLAELEKLDPIQIAEQRIRKARESQISGATSTSAPESSA